MEQNNGEIFTHGQRATAELERLKVWQNSSAVFFIHAPDGSHGVSILIGVNEIEAAYDVGRRCWRVYVQPLYLTNSGSFCYTVRALDEYGNISILGRGTLEIVPSVVSESVGSGQSILPANTYAYNPLTRKYHKLIATQDTETGDIVISVNQTGETL